MNKPEPIFTPDEENEQSIGFSKRDFFRVVFRHKWTILVCFVTVTTAVAFGLWFLPPTYQAEAKVLIKTSENTAPSFFSGITPIRERSDADPVNRVIETEMELIEAYPISEQVVKDNGIKYSQVYRKPYIVLLEPVMDLYDWAMEKYLGIPEDPNKRGVAATTRAFVKSLAVLPIKSKSAETNSNIISVKLKATDPAVAQKALAELLKIYVRYDVALNEAAAGKAYDIVHKDLDQAKKQVDEARERLERFAGAMEARKNRSAGGDQRNAALAAHREPLTTPRDVSSVDKYKSLLIEKERDLMEARNVYAPTSDRVRQLEADIAELRAKIDSEVLAGASNEARLDALDRDLQASEARYHDLERKIDQISLYRMMNQQHVGNRVIVEPPELPNSSDMKLKLAIGVGASLGSILLGVALAGLFEYFDHTLQTKQQVRQRLGLDLLVTIPKSSGSRLAAAVDRTRP